MENMTTERTSWEQTETPQGQGMPPLDSQEAENASKAMGGSPKDLLQQALPIDDKQGLREEFVPFYIINNHYHGNYVDNSGTIYGGVDQRQASQESAEDALPFPENLEDSIQRFFLTETDPKALAALIALATFEPLPADVFYQTVSTLYDKLTDGESSEERKPLSRLQTAQELVSPLLLQKVSVAYEPIGLTLDCLTFQSRDVSAQVRERIWQDYPQLRPVLMEWLFDFRIHSASTIDRLMAYTAMHGLARYAALHIGYARNYIFPFLEQNCTRQADIKYLAVIIKWLIQNSSCRAVADDLLLDWCNKQSALLWQIPYRLYGQEGEWKFQSKVPVILRLRMEQDAKGSRRSDLGWYKQDRAYLLNPAHGNMKIAALLVKQVSQCFCACKSHRDRYYTAVYFLVLFRWDYLTDFSNTPEMIFLKCLHDKELRKEMHPLLYFIWQYSELRAMAQQVLARHMGEIHMSGTSADYLEKPFECLAFTGKRVDYDSTIYLLRECAKRRDACPIAEQMQRHLEDCLRERKNRL